MLDENNVIQVLQIIETKIIALENWKKEVSDWMLDKQNVINHLLSLLDKEECKGSHAWTVYSRPHKCPLCDGEGRVVIKDSNEMLLSMPPQKPMKPCRGCNGKGIVWG